MDLFLLLDFVGPDLIIFPHRKIYLLKNRIHDRFPLYYKLLFYFSFCKRHKWCKILNIFKNNI